MPPERRNHGLEPIFEGLTRRDGNPVIFLPHNLERDVARFFTDILPHIDTGPESSLIEKYIADKHVLVVPGYSTNPFLFRSLGASEVYGVDIDPVTVGWQNAIKDYFHYKNIGKMYLTTVDHPQGFSREEMDMILDDADVSSANDYVMAMLHDAYFNVAQPQPLHGLEFVQASLGTPPEETTGARNILEVVPHDEGFDLIYVPFLLGMKNGIVEEENIRQAFADLRQLVKPTGRVMIIPFDEGNEFSQDTIAFYEATPGIVAKAVELSSDYFRPEISFNVGPDMPMTLLEPV